MSSELVIGVLLPDVLGTYSDAGNAVVLRERARWRGVDARVVRVTADTEPPATCDLYLLGGGEDAAQAFAIDRLAARPALCRALAGPAVTFAVCAGLQILDSLTDTGERRRDGLGLLDLTTAPRARRAVGEAVTRCELPGVGLLTGFENHRGATPPRRARWAGSSPASATVASTRATRSRGQVVATYLHGPVRARHPVLADHLLARATGRVSGPGDQPNVPAMPALRRIYLSGRPGGCARWRTGRGR